MSWQYSGLALILAVAAVVLGGQTLFAWRRRHIPGVFPILVFFVAATLWAGTSAIALANSDLIIALAMDWLAYPGIVTIPVAFLLFALWYTEHDNKPSPLFLSLLFVIPALAVILVITNEFHHLYYAGFIPVEGARGTTFWIFSRGPLYWITGSYSFVLVLSSVILFILKYRTVGALFRTQISLVLTSAVIPLFATLVYFLDLGPIPGFDWTPVTIVVSGFALVAATLFFELFSLQPQTHSLLISTMKDAVIATNASGRITLINPAGSTLFGITEDEAVGKQLGSLKPELEPLLEAGDSDQVGAEREIPLPVPGGYRTFDIQSVTIPRERDQSGGYILTFRDVTDRKQVENAFQSANRKLNLLSSIVRHDIRNRLTALFMYLDLTFETHDEKDVHSGLVKVRESADGIRSLVDFTQQYQDLGAEAPSWQAVGEVLRDAENQLKPAGIRIVDQTGGLEIFADRLFSRVIYNLLDNAIRYAEGMTTFRIRFETGNDHHVVYVEDDGSGIPENDKERIFQRGFGKHTGLGLFLVREILGITDITIRETGGLGKGARFEIMVPAGACRFPDRGENKTA